MANPIRFGHTRLIALDFAKNSLRGGAGIIYTVLTLMIGLTIAHLIITFTEDIATAAFRAGGVFKGPNQPVQVDRAPTKKELVEMMTKQLGVSVFDWALGKEDQEHAFYLARERPALASAILLVLLFTLPFLIALGAFNQFSGDTQYGRFRFLLLRTERANIFFGRFLGTFLFTSIILLILMAIIFLYFAFKARYYPIGEVAIWLVHGYVVMVLFALPYIAFCAMVSAVIDSPIGALGIIQLIIIFIPVCFAVASGIEKEFGYGSFLLPWGWRYKLLHPNPVWVLSGCAAMIGYTVLFLWAGYKVFSKRDL